MQISATGGGAGARTTSTENGITTITIAGPNHHEILRKDGDDSQYALILGVNEDTSFIAYNYLSNGDGYGRAVYLSSKTYKTLKGARKKARDYLAR